MSGQCFVPNCKNTEGALFPKNQTIKQLWLDALELQEVPNSDSFICYRHFDFSLLNNEQVKKGAIPTIRNPSNENQTSTKDEINVESVGKICRACMSNEHVETSIFDFIDGDVSIYSSLMSCSFPLEILEEDKLPKHICKRCLSLLKIAYLFRKQCLKTDEILQERFNQGSTKRRRSESERDDCKKQNVNSDHIKELENLSVQGNENSFEVFFEIFEDGQKNIQLNDLLARSEEINGGDPLAIRNDVFIKTENKISGETDDTESVQQIKKRGHRISVIKNLGNSEGNFSNVSSDIQKKRTIHAKETSRKEKEATVGVLTTLPIQLSKKRRVVIPGSEKVGCNLKVELELHADSKKKTYCGTSTKREANVVPLRLPKGIKIKAVEKFKSPLGRFPCSLSNGIFDSTFVVANNYLYECRLTRNNIRHLKCTIPSCFAQAEQKCVANSFEPFLIVKVAHNHTSHNESTQKKQMFLSIMRRKIQTDKTLNIRSLYEEYCSQDPEIRSLVTLRNVINEVCKQQLNNKKFWINSFDDFYKNVEKDYFERLHFTHSNVQFYQEKFHCEDNSMAVVFANLVTIQQLSGSKVMYIDASFKIDTHDDFKYQLVTVLVWIEDSYYPILFALINKKSRDIFKSIFTYLHEVLAPNLNPLEIVTDFEANLYYALAQVYVNSNIGGSVFYFTQNLYKKVCSLNLSKDLESNCYFRNIYHMLLMIPLLPASTVLDGMKSIELEAQQLNILELARPLFNHVRTEWIIGVTPDLFCVHKQENRINENVIAPFKKLRDFLLLTKGKVQKTKVNIIQVVEKIIELEAFLRVTYSKSDKKAFGRDLSSFHKKNVLRAWQYIEDHPKIEISNFFTKVIGYIKCMENQLWIWGFYRYTSDSDDVLINSNQFSVVAPQQEDQVDEETVVEVVDMQEETVFMDAVVGKNGVLQTDEVVQQLEEISSENSDKRFENAFIKYVYQE